ncbi:MAG TPA: radical SAM protein, partial [Candidatus Dormibacteraeota bacterium]|nr:radical SAM protein [Candidatus Dormibacteraeota bacterium]
MTAVKLRDQWCEYEDVLVDVMIGYACNVQCDYCSITDEMRRENMLTPAIMDILRDARSRGATKVAFGGGEPTIRRSLLPLVRWCRDRGWTSIKVSSNAL